MSFSMNRPRLTSNCPCVRTRHEQPHGGAELDAAGLRRQRAGDVPVPLLPDVFDVRAALARLQPLAGVRHLLLLVVRDESVRRRPHRHPGTDTRTHTL